MYIYIYIYRKRRCETQQQIWRTKENLKTWTELAENLWWQKQAYWANTGNLKIGGLLWLAKSVRSRQTADRDITTCFCVCFFIHAVTFSLRFYFSEGEKRRPEIRLRLARYVTLQLLDFKTLDKGEQAFSYSHRGAKKGKVEGHLPPPPPLIFLLWYDDIAQLKITFM